MAVRRRLPRAILAAVPLLLALAALLLPAGGIPARAAAYDRFYANFAGEELMRAMNADRASLGLAPLATDSTLEGIARDRALVCPSNASLTIRGRARDMADRGYLSHTIPDCTNSSGGAYDSFDLLKAFGYTYAAVGEDIGDNNYPSGAVAYATGCSLSGSGCSGSTTLPQTVAIAERAFMSSSGHRANLLSATYGRFGCGAWASASGYHYFACYFVQSGNGALDGTGPAIGQKSGVGGVFAAGSSPTFTASADDAHSLLSDGWAAIDGVHIRNWAWDHAGSTSSMSATAPALKPGTHTFTWWVRDASTRATSASFTFSVGASAGTTQKPTATARPSSKPTSKPTAPPRASPAATSGPSFGATPSAVPAPSPQGPDAGGSAAPFAGLIGPRASGDASAAAAAARNGEAAASLLAILVAMIFGGAAVLLTVGPGRLGRAARTAVSRWSSGDRRKPR